MTDFTSIMGEASREATWTQEDARKLAERLLCEAPKKVLRELALLYVAGHIDSVRRNVAHRTEKMSAYEQERRERISERNRRRYRERKETEAQEINEFGRVLSYEERSDRTWARLNAQLAEAAAAWENSIRLKVTEELLASSFALGDGTVVTWGKATCAQHQQRMEMLVGQAAGTLETAALHKEAIRMCDESGVGCLEELPVAA